MTVETTILVEFNGGTPDSSEYLAVAELDDVSNDDKTTFLPKEEPVIRSHFSRNIRVDDVVSTDGGLVHLGGASRSRESVTLFTGRDSLEPTEFRLPVVPSSTSVAYDGRQGGYTTEGLRGGMVNLIGDVNKTPFLMRMTNGYAVNLYRLIPPSLTLGPGDTYMIYVVFYLTLLES